MIIFKHLLPVSALCCLLLATLGTGIDAASRSVTSVPAVTTVQALNIVHNSDGPIVRDFFGRFGPRPLVVCPVGVGCPIGSHKGAFPSCQVETKQHPLLCCECQASECADTDITKCCAEPCIQDYPPQCAACPRTGYCKNP